MLFRGYNPEQLWHPWTAPWQASVGLNLLPSLPLSLCFFSLLKSAILFFIYPSKSLSLSIFGLLLWAGESGMCVCSLSRLLQICLSACRQQQLIKLCLLFSDRRRSVVYIYISQARTMKELILLVFVR